MSIGRIPPRPSGRAAPLNHSRQCKMARSAHAYVRGNTARFYEWLAATSGDRIPDGPPIWICGDCHVGNLGPVADGKGRVGVQIRDLDQAVIGNPAHDLIRLGLSLSSACRSADLPGATSVRVVDALLGAYARAFVSRPAGVQPPKLIQMEIRAAVARTWKQLARDHLKHIRPHIPLGPRFWPLSRAERSALTDLLAPEALIDLAPRLGLVEAGETATFVDAAYWVKGCSSLGRPRFSVLLEIAGGKGASRLAMLDIKDAPPAAAPRDARAKMPRDNAERVVAAARALSPALGERMIAVRLQDRPMVMRELAPQDLKIEPERLPRDAMEEIARYLGQVIGEAHARQMSSEERQQWHRSLRSSRSKLVDAPSWLWQAIVDALAGHEHGYLEHCRRYIAAIES